METVNIWIVIVQSGLGEETHAFTNEDEAWDDYIEFSKESFIDHIYIAKVIAYR